ncbi:MAG: glutathione S-transferase family protein [Candidatus Binataceae bacterium]
MKLFTFATSPYARKVRMALDYKGVLYDAVERCYSLDRKQDLREVNARAEVPALVLDDGRALADSTIICEYLEDAYPHPPLFPSDPYERARMRRIEDLCDRALDAVSYSYWLTAVRSEAPEAEAMRTASREEFTALLWVLERELGDREFFCGELSIADLAAICYVPFAGVMGIEIEKLPRLQAWAARMREIPTVAADLKRLTAAISSFRDLKAEFEGPDGRVHWRDSRLEWPLRHGFFDFVAREFRAGKMMFPPQAS